MVNNINICFVYQHLASTPFIELQKIIVISRKSNLNNEKSDDSSQKREIIDKFNQLILILVLKYIRYISIAFTASAARK